MKNEKHAETILHFLLSPYGFSETQQQNILGNILKNGTSGKIFLAEKHKLLIERNELVIFSNFEENSPNIKIRSLNELKKQPLFKISVGENVTNLTRNDLIIEENKLIFPIKIRSKNTGDKFKPFGMKGFKLLSDFLKDEKLTNFEKDKVKLLVNGNDEIIWVIAYRSDERYRVKPGKKHLKISVIG